MPTLISESGIVGAVAGRASARPRVSGTDASSPSDAASGMSERCRKAPYDSGLRTGRTFLAGGSNQSEEAMAERTKRRRGAKPKDKYWSHRVMQTSNALDLEPGVFTLRTPRRIALSLKRSAERSHRRKSDPYRSALSMLTFHINRAGKTLPAPRKPSLEKPKNDLPAP